MKKVILSLFIMSLAFSAQAQWRKVKGNGDMKTETRSTADYDEVSIGGPFTVDLVKGNEGKITVEADENLMEYIITETNGDKLKIKIKDGYNVRPSGKIKVTVPFTTLNEVNLAGSGNVTGQDLIKTSSFKCAVAGSGNLNIEVEAQEIEASVAGSGNLELSGDTDEVKMRVAGSGNVKADQLTVKNIDAAVAGSGDIDFDCDDCALTARVSGSGDISYSGNTSREDIKVSGSGKVRKK